MEAKIVRWCLIWLTGILIGSPSVHAQWVTRDHRWETRGPWMWALMYELPDLTKEFNGIDFGHAHLAETLIRTQQENEVEKARLEVLNFIFSSPPVPPDEEQVAPIFTRLTWEVQRSFNWAHMFHRTLYDIFASDKVKDKKAAYKKVLSEYLNKDEAITCHTLDLHERLWSFPESKSFRNKFRKFNTQIWAYHWLQGGTYDVQLMGGTAERQRELMPKIIEHYHEYLKNPPIEWESMPMIGEASPEFAKRFPEAAAIFDNLHMLHDNIDDVLSRPDLFPDLEAKRKAILKILPIYLQKNHAPDDKFRDYHGMAMNMDMGMAGGDMKEMKMLMGPRPPSAIQVIKEETDTANPHSGSGVPINSKDHMNHAGEMMP